MLSLTLERENGGVKTLNISTTVTNYNVLAAYTVAFGAPVGPAYVILNIAGSAIVGATSTANYALDIGQFPAGSSLVVNNSGSIQGAGGLGGAYYSAGQNGGNAIQANYPNQKVVINNLAGGQIYAGGGGGGAGGWGGAGGTGGQGTYNTYQTRFDGNNVWETPAGNPAASYFAEWAGVVVTQAAPYSKGTLQAANVNIGTGSSGQYIDEYSITKTTPNYTSGGAGGPATAGGAGGNGRGYNQGIGGVIPGGASVGGNSGGTNAGTGGASGHGGSGGAGGDWGVAASAGSIGATGSTGAAGNYGAGVAGNAGGAGLTGGTAGYYLVKSSANVTFNNSGSVAGGLI